MTQKISIQVYSDIHLELGKEIPKILPTARYLFLSGDICKLNHRLFFIFFDYCSPLWDKIFYTPGNHEFYSSKKNYDTLDFEYNLKLRERYKNIYYLNNNSTALNDEINIYGCVFWSEYYNYPSLSYIDDNYANIYQFSKTKGYNIKINDIFINELAKKELDHIRNYFKMNKNSKKKTIIMTHFPPIKIENINNNNDNDSNNELKKIQLENVPLWISGHTHKSHDIMYNNIRFLSNQVGYKNQLGYTGLFQEGRFEIFY